MSSFIRSVRWLLILLVPFLLVQGVPALAAEEEEQEQGANAEATEPAGDAAPRAVKALNAWVGGQYAFESIDETPNPFRNRSSELGAWLLVGNVTIPVLDRFGARVQLFGGEQSIDSGYSALEDGDRSVVGGFFEAFWRDPGLGTLAIGYQISNQERTYEISPATGFPAPIQAPVEENVQVFSVRGGLYLGDFDVDAELAVSPRTAALITPLSADETGARSTDISAGIGPRWYAADWLALRTGFYWTRVESAVVVPVSGLTSPITEIGKAVSDSYEARFAVDAQLPTIGRGPIFVSLFGGVGGAQFSELPPGFVRNDPMFWSVGGSIVFAYPRPDTIEQWVREYR